MQTNLKRLWENMIVYQIYPRSFQDSNGDGIGDLQGIIDRLDYLNSESRESLGVDAIWLAPIYASPMVDFGYDVSDYYTVHPDFGTLETLKTLISESHKREIALILDFIPNHTSSEHQWFKESRASRNNPYRDWYIWRDAGPEGGPPNNWVSRFGGSAWQLDSQTGQYYLHSFLKEQPDLNWRNPEVVAEIQKIFQYWMNLGIDGFRVDSVNFLLKDAQFRDDPVNPEYRIGDDPYFMYQHQYSSDQPDLYRLLNELYKTVFDRNGKFIVSEAYTTPQNIRRLFEEIETRYHAPFNFDLIRLPFDTQQFKTAINTFQSTLRNEDIPVYVLGNHDNSRAATRFGGEAQARIAAMLLLTLPGIPFIYYGEEIGMEDSFIAPELRQDPAGKEQNIDTLNRDGVRTPMQWDSTFNAGFSSGAPWIPISSQAADRNVLKQMENPTSIFRLYQQLIHLRHTHLELTEGTYSSDNRNDVFAYTRQKNLQTILVVLNFENEDKSIGLGTGIGSVLLSTYLDQSTEKINMNSLKLRPYEGMIIELT